MIGRQHMLEHMKVARAQMRAYRRWMRMTPAERRRERRAQRRAQRRAFVRASAAADGAADLGSWAPPFVMTTDYEGYAVHAAMLHTGKVLMWGRQAAPRGIATYAWLWDPAQGYGPGAMEAVTPTDASGKIIPIFCSGMSFLADGRLLVVGGTLKDPDEDTHDAFTSWAGLDAAIVFDPVTETWTELPRPTGSNGRWYPSQVLLGDGRTLVVSGLLDDAPGGLLNDAPEIYNPGTNAFTLLGSPAQRRDMALYPHLFTMPDGKVLLAGPARTDSDIFDPANLAAPWTDLPQLATRRDGGNAVLLPDGTDGSTSVAAIGGLPSKGAPPAFNEMIDLASPTPTWGNFPAQAVPRVWANTVQLPDGSMVTIGGDDKVSGTSERAVELYDPATGTWRTGPSQVETRAYHSTALLLPDGRVLSTGDDRNPPSPDDTGEIYSPPYLFKGPRPVISSTPTAVRWDVPFGVGTTGEIDSAVLIAPSAVTHANDMSQRLVPLATVSYHAGSGYTLKSPPSANVAPPGWYMLFALNDGVPSVAKWVRLDGSAPDVPANPPGSDPPDTTPPNTSITDGPSGTVASGSASFEFSSTEAGASFECKLDSAGWQACTNPKGYSGLSDGSHTFSVRASDLAGNVDQTPAARTWTVDTTAPDTTLAATGPSGTVASTAASFEFSSPEPGASFECKLDSAGWQACTSPKGYSGLSDGSHTFSVRAKDGLGNADASPPARTWTVDTIDPETSLAASGPSGTVASGSASFQFSSEAGASFECKLDTGNWAACLSPKAYSGLSDGSHTFSVRSIDTAGNIDKAPAARTWTVDTTAPDTTLAATGPSGTVASTAASFGFSSDDWSASFECKLDAGGWQACSSPKQYTALVDGGHIFYVRAKDAVGNTDATPESRAWTVDTTPPDTSITAGPSGTVASSSASFQFSSEAGSSFECRLGSAGWQACTNPKDYSGLSDGPYTFEVRAKDAAGNVDPTPASRAWTVDLTAPAASISQGPSGTVASASASFQFFSADESASFECKLDSADWQACSSPKGYSGLSEGSHTFYVRARDTVGNVHGEPTSRTWTVDTTAPDTSLTGGPHGTLSSNAAAFEFSSGDGTASFECKLDAGAWEVCVDPKTYASLSEGPHTFSVRARDSAGNVDSSPASQVWTIDLTPPETEITAGPVGTVTSASAVFSFGSPDVSASFECKLDDGAWDACTSARSYASLAEGGHTFSVRATDAAGNADPSPAAQAWAVDTTPEPEPEPDPTPDPDPEPDPDPDPTPEPAGPADSSAEPDGAGPELELSYPERRWLRQLRRTGRLRVRVTVDEDAQVVLRLLRGKRRVARVRAELEAGTHRLHLRPREGTLEWLRRADSPRLRFSAVAVDVAGNDSRWTRLLKPALRRSYLP